MKKSFNYSDFFQQIRICNEQWKTVDSTGFYLAWGTNEFFLDKTINAFKLIKGKTLGINYSRHASEDLTFEKFSNIWQQGGMFADHEIHLIDHIEKNKKFEQFLDEIPAKKNIGNHILLTFLGAKLPAKMEKHFDRLETIRIPCFDPAKNELPKLITDLSKKHQIILGPECGQFLLDTIGVDLFQLENELKKLSMIFANQKIPMTPNLIAEHLGYLKEDHIFQLTDFILKNQNAHAQCLIDSLIDRGESGLAILGILTKHLRNTIIIADGMKTGKNLEIITRESKLPQFVVKSYNQYIRRININSIIKALSHCQTLDLDFKSRRLDEKLVLGELLAIIS